MDAFDEIAVRVEEREAAAVRDILPDEELQQRRFACPGFPDHVQMCEPIWTQHAKRAHIVAPVNAAEIGERRRHPRILAGNPASHRVGKRAGNGHRRIFDAWRPLIPRSPFGGENSPHSVSTELAAAPATTFSKHSGVGGGQGRETLICVTPYQRGGRYMGRRFSSAPTMLLERARNQLATIWFVGGGILLVVLVVQSILGKYESLQEVWAWFVPTVVPSLSLMLGVIAADALAGTGDVRTVKVPFFHFSRGLSLFYLGLLAVTIFLEPFSPTPGMQLFTLSNYWLTPTQGLAVAAIGAVFATQEPKP